MIIAMIIAYLSLILLLFFFSSWKANKEKRKKDRQRYFNRSVINISLLFNNSCSEFIYDINDYDDSCGKMAGDGISPASPSLRKLRRSMKNIFQILLGKLSWSAG